ncbi:hypothetical protein AB6A40_011312 [Gnathostoma spinigerum]|uniref:Uncharacterized protein n=1 Tax=Gnathostoma spinigerum TaxID=75299 RepID=A0ABD6EXW3_9BILA
MITVGCHVVVQKVGGEHIRVCQVARKQGILIEKLRFIIDGAIGKPFGLFEVKAGQLSPADAETLLKADGFGDIGSV